MSNNNTSLVVLYNEKHSIPVITISVYATTCLKQ